MTWQLVGFVYLFFTQKYTIGGVINFPLYAFPHMPVPVFILNQIIEYFVSQLQFKAPTTLHKITWTEMKNSDRECKFNNNNNDNELQKNRMDYTF